MDKREDKKADYFVQRIILGHDQVLDLICFGDDQAVDNIIAEIMTELQKKKTELESCPLCQSDLVYPVERYQVNDMEWRVLLLCPNCLCKRDLVIDREQVRELLKKTRTQREQLMKQLEVTEKKNMQEEAEKFIDALNKDHIQPIDF